MTSSNDREKLAANRPKPLGFGEANSRNVPGDEDLSGDIDWSSVDDYLARKKEQGQLLQQFLQTANSIGDRDIENLPPAFRQRVLALREVQEQAGDVDRTFRGWSRSTPVFELPGQARPALEPGR